MDLIGNLLEPDPQTVHPQRIYTTGCRMGKVTDLPALLKNLDAVLIDIRFAPSGTPIQWSKDYLKLLLKNKYLHVPSFGNRASKEGRIAIQNLSLGIKILTELKVNVLLMCRCDNEGICHRPRIVEELKKRGAEVEELTLSGAE